MNPTDFHLNELPYHLDIAVFWLGALAIGLGFVTGVRKLADAIAHTDRMAYSHRTTLHESAVEQSPSGIVGQSVKRRAA
jgi:hypothetical protein